MNLFINKAGIEPAKEDYPKTSVPFKSNKKVVVELSDEIFKIASAAIAATGIATLGINASNHLRKKSVEEAATIKEEQNLISRSEFGNRLGIKYHSIEWHLNEEHIVMTEDNLIDLNNRFNKRFVETFKKGTRFEETLYTKNKYKKLQSILGKNLPLDYCLKYGLLVADEEGVIDTLQEPNKEFIEKIKNKEITYKNFFMSKEQYAKYLTVHLISINRALERGDIILNEKDRVDINRAENKTFEEKVRLAQKRAKEKGLKRATSFIRVPDNIETKLTQADFAEKLGYKSGLSLEPHIRNGRVIVGKDGFIDITVEPNKSFMEAKLNGTYMPQPDRNPKIRGKKEVNPNEFTQVKFSGILGMSPSTLREYIKWGHVVLNERGKIDITDEKNKYFMEHYKKGASTFGAPKIQKPTKPIEKEPEIEIKNPNVISLKDLTYITGLTLWPLIQHAKRGRIIREKDGIDVTNPANKFFVNRYEENCLEKLDKMSPSDLNKLKQRVENRYRSLIPKSIYVQAKEAKNKSEADFEDYIKNTVYALFRVEILSPQELKFMEKTVKNIIKTRLEDSSKPADFSDIKDFSLSGVIELEHELIIIDKLINLESKPKYPTGDITSFLKNQNTQNINAKYKNNINFSKFLKDNSILVKWNEFFTKLQAARLVDVDKLSVDDLKIKLFEFYNSEKVSKNKELSEVIEFLYEYNYAEDDEIVFLKSFVKELIRYNESFNGKNEFSKELIEQAKKIEKDFKANVQKKQECFDNLLQQAESNRMYLYSIGLNEAADIFYKYIPKSVDDNENISNMNYINMLVNILKSDIELSEDFTKTHSEKEIIAEKDRLSKLRTKEVFYTILGFDAEKTNPDIIKEANDFANTRYGQTGIDKVGEYAFLLNQIKSCDFASYPEFSYDFLYDLIGQDNKKIAVILSKLNEWSELDDAQKHQFLSMYKRFSKKDDMERKLLNDYLQKYYINFDTVIIATGWNDNKIKIPAVMTQRVKEKEMYKAIKENELIDYIEEFESCMGRIVGKRDTFGIKEYEGNKKNRTHEVKVSYPARLYCKKGKEDIFIFDDFDYNAHQGSNT